MFTRRFSIICAAASALAFGPAVVHADNLTNLSSAAPSLLSQGTPSDVLNHPSFDYGTNGRELTDNITAAGGFKVGWTMNATFTPSAADVAVGATRLIMEIGGTTNGTGLWLVNGVPTLSLKTAISPGAQSTATPSSFVANDLDLTDNAAAIYSSFGKLAAGNEVTVAVSWNAGDTFTMATQDNAVQRGVLQSARVSGASNNFNWYGNGTFLEGDIPVGAVVGSLGGLNENTTANPLQTSLAVTFGGAFNGPDTLFWNAPATLTLADPAKPVLTLAVNRATGAVTLTNPTTSAVQVNGYTLSGGRGGFDTGSGAQKSAAASNPSGLFTLAANGGSQNLGNIWVKSPFSDVGAEIDLAAGDPVNALVTYTGGEFPVADYNLDGNVSLADWPTVLNGLVSNTSALSGIGRYLAGDVNGDGAVNRADFRAFKSLLPPAEQSLLAGVPEPSTIALFGVVGAALLRRTRRWLAVATVAIPFATIVGSASASEMYFVNNAGEIRSFTGFTVGANPLGANPFTSGTLRATVAAYASYQDFTQVPDGRVFGVNSAGGVDVWANVTNWLANTGMTNLSTSAYGAEVTTSPRSGIHGASFDGATGGFYVIYEGPDAREGDLGQYANLNAFVNNTGPVVTASGYNGNFLNFYYPSEDAPATTGLPNAAAAPGSNYIHVSGTGQLEGWTELTSAGFGYVGGSLAGAGTGAGGNRSFQVPGFGTNVIAGFADVTSVVYTDLTLRVNTTTGAVSLKRGATAQIIDYIQVDSPGGSLTATGFTGLGGSGLFPQGNGGPTSNGWDQAATNATSINTKAEAFVAGNSTIATTGAEISLGAFYDTSKNLQDLSFSFDLAANGTTKTVTGLYIEYYQSAGPASDVNGDGKVSATDFLQIQRTNPTLIPTWKLEYGLGAATAAFSAVPEPSVGALASLAVAITIGTLRRKV